MKETCDCGSKTIVARPLKYSPHDRMTSYRRQAKAEDYRNRDLI